MTDPRPAPADAPSEPGTFDPLRVPAFRRIWGATLISYLGTFLQLTAAPWLMNELTGSPLLVSLVTTALTVPRLFLTLPSGALADAVDRRTLLLTGQLTSAVSVVIMTVLTAADLITPGWLLLLTFALGVGSAITLPAFQTLIPDLVEPSLRAQAITLNSAGFNVARAVGPSIGGALVAAGLTAGAFGANAASYLAVVGVLLTFPRQEVEPAHPPMWRSAAVGMRYVRFTRPLRLLLVMAALFSLTTASVQALLPNVASDELGLGATGFGVLYGLFGVGALVAALTRGRALKRFGERMLPGAIAGFGIAGTIFGLALSPLVSGIALVFVGVAWVWTLTTLNASIQILAPRWVRGRVVSIYILALGFQPVGAFLSGVIAEVWGAGAGVVVMTVATLLLGVVAARQDLPVLGRISEPVLPEDWVMPPHAARVAGTPIVVATTWEVAPEDVRDFLGVMRELRRQRLRTGAHRWSLYRDANDPHRITEFFAVHDWDEHLAQHARIDAEAAEVIGRARAFDRTGGPVTRHLAGLDVVDPDAPSIEEQFLTVHEELHRTDGSVQLPR